uniref:dolichyl-P-Man:Man5GlcNAc2-PP-dolichol alpha-1,3-mannosyltransferase n=1 Tax=Ditylum brightwellii TaxID=49249 RepID=A0A7S4S5Q9_9STRA
MSSPAEPMPHNINNDNTTKEETDDDDEEENEISTPAGPIEKLYVQCSTQKFDIPFLTCLLLLESILCAAIIKYISYTEIDWEAYMSEVTMYEEGERNYIHIRGGTGPLVYPAGFLYLYSALKYVAGGDGSDIVMAQILFGVLYVANIGVVLSLYMIVGRRMVDSVDEILTDAPVRMTSNERSHRLVVSHVVWTWRVAMCICCLSKRIHSIFVLRLFNDAPAMFLCYLSMVFFVSNKWRIGCLFYSLGVSIKMNVLLFAPGLLLLLLQSSDNLVETIICLGICAVVQLILGAPFLLTFPVSYLRKAFELDRVFFYEWTVNWKFLPEDIFVSKPLSIGLLLCHIGFLVLFAIKWLRSAKDQTGSYLFLCNNPTNTSTRNKNQLTPEYIIQTMFLSNFIGIVFARTLHYQFYSWYFYSVPFMLMFTLMKRHTKLMVVIMIEFAFNTFPAMAKSSAVLQMAHVTLLSGVLLAGVPQILYVKSMKQD